MIFYYANMDIKFKKNCKIIFIEYQCGPVSGTLHTLYCLILRQVYTLGIISRHFTNKETETQAYGTCLIICNYYVAELGFEPRLQSTLGKEVMISWSCTYTECRA